MATESQRIVSQQEVILGSQYSLNKLIKKQTPKQKRSLEKPIAGQYAIYADVIKAIVPHKESAAVSLTDIINEHDFKSLVKEQHPSLLDLSANVTKKENEEGKPDRRKQDDREQLNALWNRTEIKTFRTGIARIVEKLIKIHHPSLHEVPCVDRSSGKHYYWESLEAKEEAIGREIESDEHQEAKITIYKFIDNYLSDFLPPEMLKVMHEDIESAARTKDNFSQWSGKLRFLPPNLEASDKHSKNPEHIKKWELIFNALRDNKVLNASYKSLHKGSIPEKLTLSPQRIDYHDQKVVLLAYIHNKNHNKNIYKSFHLYRLNDLSEDTFTSFHKIDWNDYLTNFTLELRVAEWVAQSLLRSNFGINLQRSDRGSEEDSGRVVTLQGEIALPTHFNKEGPDTFDCINYLSRYGDALKIIKPTCLQDEMARRVKNMYALYSSDNHRANAKMLLKSAHEQTDNNDVINELDKRYK